MANNGWPSATFAELIERGSLAIGDGYRAKNNELGGSGLIFLRAGHVTDTTIDFSGVDRFHEELTERVAHKTARPGDAVITTKGNSTGRVTFIGDGLPPFVYSPHLSYWRSRDPETIVPRFLYYWSRSAEFQAQLRGMSASTDMAPYLSLQDQRRLRITLPPTGIQRRIAEILGTLDDKIELNRRMNETLESMARALFKSWFIDFDPVRAKAAGRKPMGIDPVIAAHFASAFEKSARGEIPVGWRVGRVLDCAKSTANGGTPRRDIPEYWEPPTVPWLTSGEVRQPIIASTINHISEAGLENSSTKLWPPWTTVVALYGATAGQTCLIATELCANQACCGLVPVESFGCFNYLALSGSLAFLSQQARGSAQQNLSKQIVEDCPVVLPPMDIAAAFETAVAPLFEKWIHSVRESDALATARDALLPRLLSAGAEREHVFAVRGIIR